MAGLEQSEYRRVGSARKWCRGDPRRVTRIVGHDWSLSTHTYRLGPTYDAGVGISIGIRGFD